MRIGVDVMGGDHAPDAILKGCIEGLAQLAPEDVLVLIGDKPLIEEVLLDRGIKDPRIEIVHTSEVIGMGDHPAESVRKKKDSSIVRMAEIGSYRHEKLCDAVLSAGNTGACVASAVLKMGRLPYVHRPGICVTIPAFHGPLSLIDAGANPDPKAINLWQYALMAEIIAQKIHRIEKPRVAVMNIGSEEGKGGEMLNRVAEDLRKTPDCNFIGFVEGRDLFEGVVDVVVTDAFTGNTVLKVAEGLVKNLFALIAREIMATDPGLATKFEPVARGIYRKNDYHEFGGAPLLGVRGGYFIAHGSSEAKTIRNAIRACKQFHALGVNDAIVKRLGDVMPLVYPTNVLESDREHA